MSNSYITETRRVFFFLKVIPEGAELCDLCYYCANKYSSILACHLDGTGGFLSIFRCAPKNGNCQAGFLKLNFRMACLFDGYMIHRQIK